MNAQPLYHYTSSRRKQARTYINMALMALLYIAALFSLEPLFEISVPDKFFTASTMGLGVAAVVLLLVAVWHYRNPALYEATITTTEFHIDYPDVPIWSFRVAIADISRIEHRATLSHAGQSRTETGIVMKDGTFHEISMNYGNSIGKMYKALRKVNPAITFPSKLHKKINL